MIFISFEKSFSKYHCNQIVNKNHLELFCFKFFPFLIGANFKSLHNASPFATILTANFLDVYILYGIIPPSLERRRPWFLSANNVEKLEINFSFQKSPLQCSRLKTLAKKKASLYHLKCDKVGHLKS